MLGATGPRSLRRVAVSVSALLAGGLVVLAPPSSAAERCFGKPATIVGTDGADNLQGTDGADVVVLRGGADFVATGAGLDLVCGGGGDDQLRLGIGADRSDGGAGDDLILAAQGDDLMRGGAGADRLTGGAGDDAALGQDGRDVLAGNDGRDRLVGGPGGETLIEGHAGDDVLAGGGGSDTLLGDAGDDRVAGGPGNFDLMSYVRSTVGVHVDLAITGPQATGQGLDTLTAVEGLEGTARDDGLFGNDLDTPAGNGLFGLAGEDLLDGRERVDFAAGDQGDDSVYGRTGADELFGGNGDEVAGDFGSGGPGFDLCDEFEADDGTCESSSIRLSAVARGWTGVWSEARRGPSP